jgi:hypothetical protein
VVVHVEDKILSHHCKADQADITRCIRHFCLQKPDFIIAAGITLLTKPQWPNLSKRDFPHIQEGALDGAMRFHGAPIAGLLQA